MQAPSVPGVSDVHECECVRGVHVGAVCVCVRGVCVCVRVCACVCRV